MEINVYQAYALGFAQYKHPLYPAMGLVGEAGEFADKLAKKMRRMDSPDLWASLTQDERDDLRAELGDVLWMLAACAHHLDTTLDDIAKENLDKLTDRMLRNVIDGAGDHR